MMTHYMEMLQARDQSLVSNLENFYESASIPAEVVEWSEDDKALRLKQIEEAKGEMQQVHKFIEETEAEIEHLKVNRTTRDSTAGEMMKAYPEIAKEIDGEIDRREWFKETIGK